MKNQSNHQRNKNSYFKYTSLLNIKGYEEQFKRLLAKRDHFPNFEI